MVFLFTKELIFGFQILNLKDHFSASLNEISEPVIEPSVATPPLDENILDSLEPTFIHNN